MQIKDSAKGNIDSIFTQQKEYALSLRRTDYRQRLAVLKRFKKKFKELDEGKVGYANYGHFWNPLQNSHRAYGRDIGYLSMELPI